MSNCPKCNEPDKMVLGCPPKIVQINNPPEVVFFHRVDIPAAMGDDTTYPPENGLYRNVLVVYEANDNAYLYNSDGIPTKLTANIEDLENQVEDLDEALQEESEARLETDIALREDLDALSEEVETWQDNPDVVDIVADYAALENYDTSTLTDKDVIRVLADETHNDASTYYRWSTTSNTWTFIGITGPYYTKDEVDGLLSYKQDTLTFDTTPTANSSNPVTSDGIKTYVDNTVAGATSNINSTDWSALWQ